MNVILPFRKVYRQTYRAFQVHGAVGTVQLALEKSRRMGRRVLGMSAPAGPSSFDLRWNVQTDGNEDLSELQVLDKTNYLLGNRYQATAPEVFQRMLDAHPVPYDECVFIDCGSGKGRVLLMASDLPFKRIIGVEFAADLTEIAKANIKTYRNPAQKCGNLEAVCMDATIFPFPLEPTVLFIANPFEGTVMEKFVEHVERSLEGHPRPFHILYRNPKGAALWDKSAHFRRVVSADMYVVYSNAKS